VITAAPTLAEAKELLVDALHEYFLSLGPGGQPPAAAAGGTEATRLPVQVVIDAA
jgi:hypothetical protein